MSKVIARKHICIEETIWVIYANGDCLSEYNAYYNLNTKQSNLKVIPEPLLKRLRKEAGLTA